MQQLNCKNCGAPIEHNYTHRCRYCDSLIMFDDEEEIEEVNPNDDLVESWEQLSEEIKRAKMEALTLNRERIENDDEEFKRVIIILFFIFFIPTLVIALMYLVP